MHCHPRTPAHEVPVWEAIYEHARSATERSPGADAWLAIGGDVVLPICNTDLPLRSWTVGLAKGDTDVTVHDVETLLALV